MWFNKYWVYDFYGEIFIEYEENSFCVELKFFLKLFFCFLRSCLWKYLFGDIDCDFYYYFLIIL